MKKIKINFADMWVGFDKERNFVLNILKDKYDVEISSTPDYLVYSVFGNENVKYNNSDCIKIFYTSENVRPDFNECDYALGYDYIKYEDRYYRCPLYILCDKFELAVNKHKLYLENRPEDKKFCNFVYSNGMAKYREEFFQALSKYRQVDSGGKYINNIGYYVDDKLEFQKEYKFSIAFENTEFLGYTTEKIIDAFAAGTIPIYWGNPEIVRDFNEEAFINCYNYNNFEEIIDVIKKIDNDEALYMKYISEPIFSNNCIPCELEKERVNQFFYNIFDQDKKKAQRRIKNPYFDKQEYINKNNRMQNIILSMLNYKDIIGWGASGGKRKLEENNIYINYKYFVDNDVDKLDEEKKIYSPQRLFHEKKEDIFIIVLTIDYYEEVKKELIYNGFEENKNFIGIKELIFN